MRLAARNECQISAEDVNRECSEHENRAHPEAPVAMHSLPIGTRSGFAPRAAVSFRVVLVSGHFVSKSTRYDAATGCACCTLTIRGSDALGPVNFEQDAGLVRCRENATGKAEITASS